MFCTVYPYFYLSIFNRIHILVIELRMTTFLMKTFDDDDDDHRHPVPETSVDARDLLLFTWRRGRNVELDECVATVGVGGRARPEVAEQRK